MSWTPEQPSGSQPPGWPPPGGQPGSPPPGYPPPGGWQPPSGPPPGYGAGYGGYPPAREHPQGTTVLILGILSLVICQLLGPVAWIMGNKAIKEIDASGVQVSNRSSVQAGRICGAIASLLMLVVIVAIFAIAMLGSTTTTRFEPIGSSIPAFIGLFAA